MATLQSPNHPTGRIEVGEGILAAAEALDTSAIKTRLDVFAKAQRAYAAAQARVERAEEALSKRQAEVGEEDVEQDEAVMALASCLAGEGLPRANPFKPFGFDSPSAICKMGYGAEAKEVQRLTRTIIKRKSSGKETLAAAKRAEKAAIAVEKALGAVPKLEQDYRAALAHRDALAQPWETAFAALKRGARAAEDDGSDGLFDALFDRPAKAPARKAPPKTPDEPPPPPPEG